MHESPGGAAIVVVGLGPGDMSMLTIGALEVLRTSSQLYVRTTVHPTIEPLRKMLKPAQSVVSFDELYQRADSFDQLYEEIARRLLDASVHATEPIVYAVPGHPLVGERTVSLLRELAPEYGVTITVRDGMSYIEPVLSALGIDPLASGMTMVDGAAMLAPDAPGSAGAWSGSSARCANTGLPMLIGQVYDRRVASACKLWLLERYPGTHVVTIVSSAGLAGSKVWRTELAALDHTAAFDHLTSIYVPPIEPLSDTRSLAGIPYIAARLRADDGCPWDRKQTMQTLKPHLLEEVHELVASLDAHDVEGAIEELGDIWLLVAMLCQIADEAGDFGLLDVSEAAITKLIRRHPHVFGHGKADTVDAVLKNWEQIKAGERERSTSALEGVPAAMPSLIASQTMQRKAAALGFEWPNVEAVFEKVDEEICELREAPAEHRLEEVGDLLFAVVSLCRHMKLDADEALRKANAKFRRRFETVESLCQAANVGLGELSAAELDRLWEEAKLLTQVAP